MTVTNLHITEPQARTLLACVRFTTLMRDSIDRLDTGYPNALPELNRLKGSETMLIAALERLRDKQARR